MKKGAVLLVLTLLVFAAFISGQDEEIPEEVIVTEEAGISPDSPLYVIDTFIDDINLALKRGTEKSELAMKVKNERIAEAEAMVEAKNEGAAIKALGNAASQASIIEQTGFSPAIAGLAEADSKKSIARLEALKAKLPAGGIEGVRKAIDEQIDQQEKIRVARESIKVLGDYCEQLAYEDFELLKEDQTCDADSTETPEWLKEYINEDLREREERAKQLVVEQVTTCVLSPRECDCSKIPSSKHQIECEVNKQLAIKCEHDNDMEACDELSKKDFEEEDMPDFLKPVFRQTMKEAIEKKQKEMFPKFRPPECSHVETPEECFKVVKELYGMPPECEGLSDEECFEAMKKMERERPEMPPECKEAGITAPRDCVKIMLEKYGKPPWCEGIDMDSCVTETMKHRGGPPSSEMMPEECAGAKAIDDCFEIMKSKYGEKDCESMEECFGRRGESGSMLEECQGLTGQECFEKIKQQQMPEECREADSREECEEIMRAKFSTSVPGECGGLNEEQCFQIMREKFEIPCRSEEECRERDMPNSNSAEEKRYLPECEGLSEQECFEKIRAEKTEEAQRNADEFMPEQCKGMTAAECEEEIRKQFSPEESREEHRGPIANTQRSETGATS